MKITNAELKIMATRRSQYPEDKKKEFLLVGRSNVGKSSFINTILNTLTQLNEVNSIKILINNETVDKFNDEYSLSH